MLEKHLEVVWSSYQGSKRVRSLGGGENTTCLELLTTEEPRMCSDIILNILNIYRQAMWKTTHVHSCTWTLHLYINNTLLVRVTVDVFVVPGLTVNSWTIPCVCGVMLITTENNVASPLSFTVRHLNKCGHNKHWNLHCCRSVDMMLKH